MSNIIYSDNSEEFKKPDTFFAEIQTGISSKDELLKAYAEKLRFPDYFGHNWDALDECLTDFHWLSEKHIVVYHLDLPNLSNDDIQKWFSILNDAIFDNHDRSVKFVFPVSLKEKVEYLVPTKEEWNNYLLTKALPKKYSLFLYP